MEANYIIQENKGMLNQTRVLIGDIGDQFAVNAAFIFRKAGDWAVVHRQSHDNMLQSLRSEHPDVLILNLTCPTMNFPVFVNAVQQLSDLSIVALFCKQDPYLEHLLEQQDVRCIRFPESPAALVQEIHRICGITPLNAVVSDADPEVEVTKLLHSFGIPLNLRGFYYLRAAILIAAQKQTCSGVMINEIYSAVAKKMNSTPARVERAIRNAIMHAWENNDIQFNWHFTPMKNHRMTNSEFIAFSVDWIQTK